MAIKQSSAHMRKPARSSVLSVPHFQQQTDYMCGPRSLQMVFRYYKKRIGIERISKRAHCTERHGTSVKNMVATARHFGFRVRAGSGTVRDICAAIAQDMPVIVDYIEPKTNWGHYAVIIGCTSDSFILQDPWIGPNFMMSKREFVRRWHGEGGTPRRWMMTVTQRA